MFIVPYMVVAAVAILFFIVCRFIVYGVGGKSRHAGVKAEVTAEIPVRPRRKKVPVRQAVPETTAEFPLRKKSAGAGKSAGETTQILPVKEIVKRLMPLWVLMALPVFSTGVNWKRRCRLLKCLQGRYLPLPRKSS